MKRGGRRGFTLSLVLASALLSPAGRLEAEGRGTLVGTVTWGPQRLHNVVVYIEKVEGTFRPPEEAAVMDQKNLTFVPHVLPILIGTTVDFVNGDGVLHNLHAFLRRETLFNIAMPKFLKKKSMVFQKEGPVLMLCDVHKEMSAYIVILQNPFFALTDEQGRFVIKDITPGSYTLRTWHEKLKPQSRQVQPKEGDEVKVDFQLRN